MPSNPSAPVLIEKFSKADASFLVARIVSVCGEKRGANLEILVSEWHDALRFYDKALIDDAWRRYRDTPPCHWPKPGEILGLIREAMPAGGGLRTFKPEDYEFCKDGRTEAEEIAHRAAVVMRARAATGFGTSPDDDAAGSTPKREPLVAPAESDISPALKEMARKGGYWKGKAA